MEGIDVDLVFLMSQNVKKEKAIITYFFKASKTILRMNNSSGEIIEELDVIQSLFDKRVDYDLVFNDFQVVIDNANTGGIVNFRYDSFTEKVIIIMDLPLWSIDNNDLSALKKLQKWAFSFGRQYGISDFKCKISDTENLLFNKGELNPVYVKMIS